MNFYLEVVLEVVFMPFQKGQVKNSHTRLNMGSKSDTEQIQNLQFQLFALNELQTLD